MIFFQVQQEQLKREEISPMAALGVHYAKIGPEN